jgi:hypothetical protein
MFQNVDPSFSGPHQRLAPPQWVLPKKLLIGTNDVSRTKEIYSLSLPSINDGGRYFADCALWRPWYVVMHCPCQFSDQKFLKEVSRGS